MVEHLSLFVPGREGGEGKGGKESVEGHLSLFVPGGEGGRVPEEGSLWRGT